MFKLLILLAVFGATWAGQVTFTLKNKCAFTVWAGMDGRSRSNGNWPLPHNGGWEIEAGKSSSVQVPEDFYAGRFWGRTNCKYESNGQFRCETGDCGFYQCAFDGIHRGGQPPATLAEFTLNGDGGQDFYDVSLVDGYNLPMTIIPKSPSVQEGNKYWCKAPGCTQDLNAICPTDLRKLNAQGQTVGCKSACERFNEDRYCCRGEFGTPDKCDPLSWGLNYALIFKTACPTAYSYAYDDLTSTFFCRNTDYDITFC